MPTDAGTQSFTVQVDGAAVSVNGRMSVAAAIVVAGGMRTRRSVSGEARFALCGMGMCQECRVNIDGVPHRLACQVLCEDGMQIVTGADAAVVKP